MSSTCLPWRKAAATDSTSSAFSVKIPTATEPAWSKSGPIWWLRDPDATFFSGDKIPKFLNVAPYGTTTNDQTLSLQVWGWKRAPLIATPLWIPTLLCELAGILSSGIDYTALATSGLGCDTLTVTSGATDEKTLGVSAISPTSNAGQASALVHLRGSEYIEFLFKVGTAVSMNAHWALMDQD
jgi:hypothetical protein